MLSHAALMRLFFLSMASSSTLFIEANNFESVKEVSVITLVLLNLNLLLIPWGPYLFLFLRLCPSFRLGFSFCFLRLLAFVIFGSFFFGDGCSFFFCSGFGFYISLIFLALFMFFASSHFIRFLLFFLLHLSSSCLSSSRSSFAIPSSPCRAPFSVSVGPIPSSLGRDSAVVTGAGFSSGKGGWVLLVPGKEGFFRWSRWVRGALVAV